MPLTANDVPATENKVEMTDTVQESSEVPQKAVEEKKPEKVVDENGNVNGGQLDQEEKAERESVVAEPKVDENVSRSDATIGTETEACVIGDKEQLQQNEIPAEKKAAEKIDHTDDIDESQGKGDHSNAQDTMTEAGWEHIEHEKKESQGEQEVEKASHPESSDNHLEKAEEAGELKNSEQNTTEATVQEPVVVHEEVSKEAEVVAEPKIEEATVTSEVKEMPSEVKEHDVASSEPICDKKAVAGQEPSKEVQEEPKETAPAAVVDKGEVPSVEVTTESHHVTQDVKKEDVAVVAAAEQTPSEETIASSTGDSQETVASSEVSVETDAHVSEEVSVTSAAEISSSAPCEDGTEENKKDIASEKVAVAEIDAPTAESSANPASAVVEPPAVSPTVEAPAIVISPAVETVQEKQTVNRPETLPDAKMSEPSTPVVRTPAPVAPPRRPSSAVLSGTLRRSPASTRSSGKLFKTLPRSTLSSTKEEVGPKKKKGMFSWLGGDSSKKKNKEVLETVSDGLRKIYKQKLYPLEEFYKFHDFHSPALDDPDFDAKPMILLVGQYSTGKTTFIRYLLEQDFPGIRIGPEPTTDRFIAVMHGDEEGVIPGNALVVDAKKQFRALSGFGNAFLNRFQCSSLPNQVLESVTIVDTPGILSGEKQRIDRGYDFTGVLEWFAERVDRIILLFDAHKLDISDEFKRCIEALAGNEDKIRIVLNKSDMVDHQQLMRVYGALMWSLGKVFRTPEVSRVYLGSFWDHPLHYDINRRLFQDEQHDLFQDLQALPRNAALRKLNDLIKRARLAKVHAYIISELRKQMPSMIGKEKKKKELIQNLDKIFEQIQREHNISPGDFPDINKMREKLQNQDFTKFNALKPKLLEVVDGMLASDIARLMAQIPKEEQIVQNGNHDLPTVKGGAFSQAQEAETPFGFGRGEGFDKGADEAGWVVNRERSAADSTFEGLGPINGFVSGRAAKEHMVKSKLPNAVLGKIWKLADVDQDGQLDADEFALANYLINLKLEGHELPSELPGHLVPPSKRDMETVYPALDEE